MEIAATEININPTRYTFRFFSYQDIHRRRCLWLETRHSRDDVILSKDITRVGQYVRTKKVTIHVAK